MSDRHTQPDVGDINEAIRHEHEQLRELLGAIGQTLTIREVPFDAVVRKFSLLRDQLESHFHHEEADGFFEQIADHAPRLAGRVSKLCAAHVEMLGEIDGLTEQAMQGDGSDGWWCFLEASFQDFAKRLMAHEREENALLHQAYCDDIGNKD
jgi:iron-sulfur cluster repair protein YtfE (RIC family)